MQLGGHNLKPVTILPALELIAWPNLQITRRYSEENPKENVPRHRQFYENKVPKEWQVEVKVEFCQV